MESSIYIIGGNKGGVGKSLVTMATVDFLEQISKRKVVLVDSDTSNPDAWKSYKDSMKTELVNLDEPEGWSDLVNICHNNSNSVIVVNTGARNGKGVSAYSKTLSETLVELQRKLVTFWVINRQRDSLEMLKEYMHTLPGAQVHVIRNGYFGEERKFELYNISKIRKEVQERGGKSVTFPDLADRVADEIYCKRLSIEKAQKELSIGDRAELRRWRNIVEKMMQEVAYE